ncbi:VirB4 family type IV secretion system protein [Capnocytophaga sputigena]|uniref:VirB4 family type IV secretion system protein n=1 Tax=Capnocytophaga sputigena TaxID=1019 RepID=UPI003C7206BB
MSENAEIENVLFGREGTFTIGYRVQLPEKYSLGEKDYDDINEVWARGLRDLPPYSIFCKHDIFEVKKYDTSNFPERNYLEAATKKYFNGKEYMKHTCNVFFSLPNKLLNVTYLKNPLRPPQKKYFNEFDERIEEFIQQVEQTVLYLNKAQLSSGNRIVVTPLDKKYMQNYYSYFSRGLDDSTRDIIKEDKHLLVGDKYVGVLSFPTEEKFPETIETCKRETSSKNAKYSFFQNYGEFFSFNIPCTHIYCQVAFMDELKKHYNDALRNNAELHKSRAFDPQNRRFAEETKKMLENMALKEDTERIIRGHNNVILFANSEEKLKSIKKDVKAIFLTLDIKPNEPSGDNQLAIYEYSFPLNNHKFVKNHLYIASLQMFAAFMNVTGEYQNDPKGVRFNSRLENTPVYVDVWDDKKKYIRARNFFILASTGGGKSFLANHILTYAYGDNNKSVVVDLGGSFKKLTTLFPQEETSYITYHEGEGLGINPFYVEDHSKVTVEKLEILADFIGVHYRREREINQEERSTIVNMLKMYYNAIVENHSLPNFIETVNMYRADFERDLSINKDFFDIEEFLLIMRDFTQGGIYSFLYEKVDNSFSANIKNKKLIVFELDKIKGNKLLLSVMLQLISTTIEQVIWNDRSTKGYIFFDEVAEQFQWEGMLRRIAYFYQAIRKHSGSIGIVLQSEAQLPESPLSKAIIENTQILYVLDSNDLRALADRFKMSDHAYYQMTSLNSDVSAENPRPYTEIFIKRGNYHQVYRLEVPKKVFWAYQTEGIENEQLMRYYEELGDMEKAIDRMMKEKGQKD